MKPRTKTIILVGIGLAGFALAGFLVYMQLLMRGYLKYNAYDRREFGRLQPGDVAPDFVLKTPDGAQAVRLSALHAEKQVVLIFASCT